MRFYKVDAYRTQEDICQAEANNDSNDSEQDAQPTRHVSSDLDRHKLAKVVGGSTAEVTERLNAKLYPKSWIALATATEKLLVFVIIAQDTVSPSELVSNYCKQADYSIEDIVVEETTFEHSRRLIKLAYRNDNIDDDDRIWYDLKLGDLIHLVITDFDQTLIKSIKKREMMARAKKLFAKSQLINELERIYAGPGLFSMKGHPVHYLVITDDEATKNDICTFLTTALYANKRFSSKRICTIDLQNDRAPYDELEALYLMSKTGVVVNQLCELNEESDRQRDGVQNNVMNACKIASKYKDDVLTIFCLPSSCANLKQLIYESMEHVSFVEISEDAANTEQAQTFLSSLALEDGITADDDLLSKIAPEETYFTTELRKIYADWRNKKLRTEAYPQYASFDSSGIAGINSDAQGDAYQELMKLIGLSEVKKTVDQFINYRKMTKYLESLEIERESMAAHMVFTGNPGTAKTTVARLIARIMRENKLLSSGHLVEVGRADLIGKYVGHTAPLVKQAFKKALGGVLFIDEAYSLVDDKKGLFGDEAINTIVQEMENHRDELVVIFAGYPDEMERFLQQNPGLRSRISHHVHFPDYNAQELVDITELIVSKKGLSLTDEARKELEIIYEDSCGQLDFGNGRFARTMVEKAILAQSSRLIQSGVEGLNKSELNLIRLEDIQEYEASQSANISKSSKIKIGFCA